MKVLINFFVVGLIALTLLGLGVMSLRMVNAAGQELPSVVALMGESPNYKLIDDFDTGTSRPCYAENGALVSAPCPIVNGYAVMSYDVTKKTNPAQPSYVWLPNDLGNMNLSDWNAVWIIIEGKNGGEKLYAEFVECDNPTYQKLEINNYISGGITNTWRAAFIPFSEFNQVTNWSCINRFSIIAHSDISSGIGEVHVNDIRLLPARVVIDDFNDQLLQKNEIGGVAGVWCDPDVPSCIPLITPTLDNGSLKLTYDVSPPTVVGAGYWTKLLSSKLFSRKDNLVLDVRGEQDDKIWVELKDCDAILHAPGIQINDYLEVGITANWQTLVIPLAAFVDIENNTRTNWNCLDQLTLNLRSNHTGEKSSQSTIYFDNIQLAPLYDQTSRVPVIVDNFNDCDRWNALSWLWQTGGQITATFGSPNQSGSYGCSYRLMYSVTFAQSAYIWAELKGLDLTGYDHLQFFVKGKTGSEIMNVCLRDRTQTEACNLLPIVTTDTWQLARMPLSQFNSPNIDLTDLENLKFAFDNRIETSEVYIDSVSFIQLEKLFLPIILKDYPLTELYVHNDNTGGDVTFVVRNLTTNAEVTRCIVPNNATVPCDDNNDGSNFFLPGTYKIEIYATCGSTLSTETYLSGRQTTRVFC
ncbi:MAG: hypothetical protein HYR94_22020 [Chloroflexi bacterium]|nr:hypothetical protein [Chloroflexota bacterium]